MRLRQREASLPVASSARTRKVCHRHRSLYARPSRDIFRRRAQPLATTKKVARQGLCWHDADMSERLDRFLARAPRISPAVVRKRKSVRKHKYRPEWMPELLKRQSGKCFYCQCPIAEGRSSAERRGKRRATMDHFKAVSQQGYNKLSNLVAACGPCNGRKGAMDGQEFLAIVRRERE